MSFAEYEFPRDISFHSTGGDRFSTTVNRGFSGGSSANRNWAKSLAKFSIDMTNKEQAHFEKLHTFFLNLGGMADPFRLFWQLDYKAINQLLIQIDSTHYQLVKNYTAGSRTYTRIIAKPITSAVLDFEGNNLTDTVIVYDGGTPIVGATTDYTTGIVTLPGAASGAVTGDCQFHIPVRLTTDSMEHAQVEESDILEGNGIMTWAQIGMEEIRLP